MTTREIVFDSETTGLSPAAGHRICSLAAVELQDRVPTGRFLHFYLDPERDSEPGALKAHGLTREFLVGKPKFSQAWPILRQFIGDDVLVIHNAKFDLGFLRAELDLAGQPTAAFAATRARCTYERAEQLHGRAKGRNTLDALATRFEIPNLREQAGNHGALIDCLVLVNIYRRLLGLPVENFDTAPYLAYLHAQTKPVTPSPAADQTARAPVAADPADDPNFRSSRAAYVAG